MTWLDSPALCLALILLHEIGKAGTHAVRFKTWARRPLVGLAAWQGFGIAWQWYVAATVAMGIVWPLSKLFKGLTLRQAIAETWYAQIINYITRTPGK